jgi:hypothetical protein
LLYCELLTNYTQTYQTSKRKKTSLITLSSDLKDTAIQIYSLGISEILRLGISNPRK